MMSFTSAMATYVNLIVNSRWSIIATGQVRCASRRETGASLLVVLMMLIILTILGLTALQVATTEERMSGNTRDRGLAFQAAEAGLRDAELDIQCKQFDGITSARADRLRAIGCLSGTTGADASCTNGLCCNANGLVCVEPATPVYLNTSLSLSASPSIEIGQYTRADAPGTTPNPLALAGVSQQPRYLIEPFVVDGRNYYRITARGYGVNASTQVTLQEIFKE